MGASDDEAELAAIARRVVEENRFMTLATGDDVGLPWASPVEFLTPDYTNFYWRSSPETLHSRNLSTRPRVAIVIFDSRATPGTKELQAVYMTAEAAEVKTPSDESTVKTLNASSLARAKLGERQFGVESVRAPSPFRLYRATATSQSTLCHGDEPRAPCRRHRISYDHRVPVALSSRP